MHEELDTIVVGGGAAGLSAALVLGRARKSVLVLDKGEQSNLTAEHVGGLLGQREVSPAELLARGREQIADLDTVRIAETEATGARPDGEGFAITLAGGEEHRARTLVLAMGQRYEYPDVPGFDQLWGRDVFHCPFCHGWEVRNRKVVVLGSDASPHQEALIRGWTGDVTVLDASEVAEARVENGRLAALVRADGSEIPCDAVMVKAEMHDRSDIPDRLGLERTEAGLVAVDEHRRTSLPGVYAAGDLAVAPQQVVLAMASGHLAGAMVVRELAFGRG